MCEGRTLSGFNQIIFVLTQGCRCAPTTGLKLANAFGVNPFRNVLQGGGEGGTAAPGDGDADAAFEDGDGRAGAGACQFANAVEANECAPVCADEAVFLHALLEKLKRLAQKVTACANPQLRIISCRFDPIDLAEVQ